MWARVVPKRSVDGERHCCFKSRDKEAASSQNVKVAVTKNVTESFVTIVTDFSIDSRYSNGSILSSVSIVSNVLLQVLLVL